MCERLCLHNNYVFIELSREQFALFWKHSYKPLIRYEDMAHYAITKIHW